MPNQYILSAIIAKYLCALLHPQYIHVEKITGIDKHKQILYAHVYACYKDGREEHACYGVCYRIIRRNYLICHACFPIWKGGADDGSETASE